jgi:DNA modification methylase
MDYHEFLKKKTAIAETHGYEDHQINVHPALKPHQADIVRWAIRGGRRAILCAFGLGKTLIQLEIMRIIGELEGGRSLIVIPLGVRQEFMRDAKIIGVEPKFIRRIEEAVETGIYLTNYETVRDEKLDPNHFLAASLDEASILRGFGGTKTFRNFMTLFAGDEKKLDYRIRRQSLKYRFVATATPAPNDFIELLAYAAFLGIMDVSQGKTRFFKRDSTKADKLTIHPHKEREFWLWCSSWAIFVQKPSDLGHDDTGYALPKMSVNWHEVSTVNYSAGEEKDGQYRLIKNTAISISESAREKRESLPSRIDKMTEILQSDPSNHFLIWHDLESERVAIESVIGKEFSIYGSQDLELREDRILKFSDGELKYLAAKPVIAGSGCNFQRHCHRAIFLGIGFKFNDFIQAIHRINRFLQDKNVIIDIIYTESESHVRKQLERKWSQHNTLVSKMTGIIKEYGLTQNALISEMTRAIGVDRIEVSGKNHRCIHNDCVLEMDNFEENSVDLILTSIPFSTQYEYSPNYADFGHTDTNSHFWQQMDFLIPKLLRALKPGRVAAIHVKDRVVPGGLTGLGYQTVYPFHVDTINHFCKHGFGYFGMKTIVTDVVRENNQTYRLGWTEQCKDGTKMGVGMPEYLLYFRKTPSETANSYADEPVVKDKGHYSRSRWQTDAHGFTRSSGNRLLDPQELSSAQHSDIFQMFKKWSLENIYDFEHHVKIGEHLDAKGKLPTTFMLLQPQSWSDEVWTDVTRMLTLNGMQHAKGKEMHLCPMQFDIADRVITQLSNPGDVVLDPFGGLMSVPYRAIKLDRFGIGIELSHNYFLDGVAYCEAAERDAAIPDLFNFIEMEHPE